MSNNRSPITLFLAFLYSLYLAASPSNVFSQSSESKNQDSKICKIQQYIDENTISFQEKWAWERISSGKPADFNTQFGKLDSARSGEWNRNEKKPRAISSKFLEIILLDETCQKEIPKNGVYIIGAWFGNEINLENAELKHQLKLEDSRFEGKVNFKRLSSPLGISLKNSFFSSQFNISWAKISGPLEMNYVKFARRAKARKVWEGLPRQIKKSPAIFEGFIETDKEKFEHKIQLIGVWIQETPIEYQDSEWVFMRGLKVDSDIIMNDGDFFPVDLQLAKIGGRINLSKSNFRQSHCPKFADEPFDRPYCEESFLMAGSQIDGEIDMKQAEFLGNISLRGTEIGNIVSMEKATFKKDLNMQKSRLKSDLIMDNSHFQCVNLSLSKIEGQLKMENAEFLGKSCIPDKKKRVVLDMQDIDIGSQLWMKNAEFYGIVRLSDASVGYQVNMENTKFYDILVMYGLRLNSRLTMKKGQFQQVALAGANIRRNLYLAEAKFNGELDLRFAKISSITLDNTRVKSLNVTDTQIDNVLVRIHSKENFPVLLQSDGFTYNQFLIQTQNRPRRNPYEREKLFNEWLDRLEKYTPQPYEQLAKVMKERGALAEANNILYKSKEKARIQLWYTDRLRWAAHSILKTLIGYGLGRRYLRCLYWIMLLVLVGAEVFRSCKETQFFEILNYKTCWSKILGSLTFSVDMFVPIVQMRKLHYEIDLPGWRRYYFYAHQLAGYAFTPWVIAGLASIAE